MQAVSFHEPAIHRTDVAAAGHGGQIIQPAQQTLAGQGASRRVRFGRVRRTALGQATHQAECEGGAAHTAAGQRQSDTRQVQFELFAAGLSAQDFAPPRGDRLVLRRAQRSPIVRQCWIGRFASWRSKRRGRDCIGVHGDTSLALQFPERALTLSQFGVQCSLFIRI